MGVNIHEVVEKIPKRGFVLPKHRYAGPYDTLYLQLDSKDRPLPGEEPYNAVDAIAIRIMRSAIEITRMKYQNVIVNAGGNQCTHNSWKT